MKHVVRLLIFAAYLAGIVIAHGFWSTVIAILFAPWAWYLVVERLVTLFL